MFRFSIRAVLAMGVLLSLTGCPREDLPEEADAEPRQCRVGEQRPDDDGCNTCTCQPDGSWACTEIGCAPECAEGELLFEGECRAGCHGDDGCGDGQRCNAAEICLPDPGCPMCAVCYGACVDAPPACEVGAMRPADDGCNTCECQADGSWACTEIACPPECPEGEFFHEGECRQGCHGDEACGEGEQCNAGTLCLEDPNCPACDVCYGYCEPAPMPGCEPGEMRPADDGCNTCECQADGSWACTEIACMPECAEGEFFHDGACRRGCGGDPECGDGARCNAVDLCLGDPNCPECDVCYGYCEPDPGHGACAPGERRPAEDGCNTCTCQDDGGWACTERACAPLCPEGEGVEYVSRDHAECADIDFGCPQGHRLFSIDDCGCGCIAPQPDCVCAAVYDPVCGVDGATYSNGCNAGCARMPIAHGGECE